MARETERTLEARDATTIRLWSRRNTAEKVGDVSFYAGIARACRLPSAGGNGREEGRKSCRIPKPRATANSQAILRSPRAVREVVDFARKERAQREREKEREEP